MSQGQRWKEEARARVPTLRPRLGPRPSPGNAGAEPRSPDAGAKTPATPWLLPPVQHRRLRGRCPAVTHLGPSEARTVSSQEVALARAWVLGTAGPGTPSRPRSSPLPTVLAGGGPRDRWPQTQSHSELLPLQLSLTQHLRD